MTWFNFWPDRLENWDRTISELIQTLLKIRPVKSIHGPQTPRSRTVAPLQGIPGETLIFYLCSFRNLRFHSSFFYFTRKNLKQKHLKNFFREKLERSNFVFWYVIVFHRPIQSELLVQVRGSLVQILDSKPQRISELTWKCVTKTKVEKLWSRNYFCGQIAFYNQNNWDYCKSEKEL